MINEKQEILATVNTLPDNTTWDDAVYTLYLHSKLQKSKDDIKNGRVMSIEHIYLNMELFPTYICENICFLRFHSHI